VIVVSQLRTRESWPGLYTAEFTVLIEDETNFTVPTCAQAWQPSRRIYFTTNDWPPDSSCLATGSVA
jgi:hypothetical protein